MKVSGQETRQSINYNDSLTGSHDMGTMKEDF
jgi:hypothetical protein